MTFVSLQEPAASATPDDRATEFKPHEGGGEVASGEVLLVEAYAAMWFLAFVLIFLSFRRQKALDRRIDRLQEDISRAREGA